MTGTKWMLDYKVSVQIRKRSIFPAEISHTCSKTVDRFNLEFNSLSFAEMSDFEKAALDEAKRLDISKMPTPTIDSVTTNVAMKDAAKTVKKGNRVYDLSCN